ncbi:MAG TPA: hypothetical protein VF472_26135 [Burkholderiaceae bacterium]
MIERFDLECRHGNATLFLTESRRHRFEIGLGKALRQMERRLQRGVEAVPPRAAGEL